jgi:hypothetical protein
MLSFTVTASVMASYQDTIWIIQNDPAVIEEFGIGACEQCHVDMKEGHKNKKECDKCHAPGADKRVHNTLYTPPMMRKFNVTSVESWSAFCSSCHESKQGHMDKDELCLTCHGPKADKDVHVKMKEAMEKEGLDFNCSDCHDFAHPLEIGMCSGCHVPSEGHYNVKCELCHDYIDYVGYFIPTS